MCIVVKLTGAAFRKHCFSIPFGDTDMTHFTLNVFKMAWRSILHLEVASSVEQQVRWLQVSVENVCWVDVLQAAQDLVQEVTDVVIAQVLCLQQLVQVRLHQILYNVAIVRQRQGQTQSMGLRKQKSCKNWQKLVEVHATVKHLECAAILLFSKDALNWSKLTVEIFIILQKISNKCCSFELPIIQIIDKYLIKID